MLTFGPYVALGLIVAGWWLFIISLAAVCIVAGAIGQRAARRNGRQCPDCDYRYRTRGDRAEVVIHDALDHPRE